MHRRVVTIAMATLFSLSAAGNSFAAPPAPFHHHTSSDKPSTGKMVRFNIRNDSGSPVVLKSGDQQYTIEAGKSLAMQLRDGAEVIAVSGTAKDVPGTVITTVSSVLKGNTLVIS